MRIKYDKEADIIYLRFREGKIAESDEIKDGFHDGMHECKNQSGR